LGKGRYWVKWERGEVWEECGGKGKVWRSGKLECMNKYPQNTTYLAFGDAPWGYRPVPYIFRKLF